MAEKPTTIEDVARLAGVSIATVSRALHKPGMVTQSTRERVQAAVAETGYTQNVMARNLRLMQTRLIVVLVPDIGNPFFSEILSGMEAEASKRGYNILIGNTNNDPERERTFASYVRGNQADGLLLLNGRVPFGHPSMENGDASRPPMVAVCERIPGDNLPTVCIDNEAATYQATNHLIELGHTLIAHIRGPAENILTADRMLGFSRALKDAGLPVITDLIVEGDFSIASGRAAATQLMKQKAMPTGIICANDEMAMGIIQALKNEGHKIPGDISVVGFDDIQFSAAYDPPLTTVHQPRRQLGQEAMRIMIDGLETGVVPEAPIIMDAELIVRESTAFAST